MADEMAIAEDMADGKLEDNFVAPAPRSEAGSGVQDEIKCEGSTEEEKDCAAEEQDFAQDFAAWADMLPDALAAIFSKLSFEELLNVVPQVCKSWRRAALDPSCWQIVDLSSWSKKDWSKRDWARTDKTSAIDRMVRLVVDRSGGGLQELTVTNVSSDESVRYVGTRCSQLRKLFIPNSPVSDCCFFGDDVKFPALQQLNISHCQVLSDVALESIGKKAINLVHLRRRMRYSAGASLPENEALAIAHNMPKLQHLELKYGQFSKVGLSAILDFCKDLQYLDVRNCGKLVMDDEMSAKVKKVKTLLIKPQHDIYDQDDLDDDEDDPWESYDDRYDEIWLSDMEEWCMASQLDSDGDVFDEIFMVDDMFVDEDSFGDWSS